MELNRETFQGWMRSYDPDNNLLKNEDILDCFRRGWNAERWELIDKETDRFVTWLVGFSNLSPYIEYSEERGVVELVDADNFVWDSATISFVRTCLSHHILDQLEAEGVNL